MFVFSHLYVSNNNYYSYFLFSVNGIFPPGRVSVIFSLSFLVLICIHSQFFVHNFVFFIPADFFVYIIYL